MDSPIDPIAWLEREFVRNPRFIADLPSGLLAAWYAWRSDPRNREVVEEYASQVVRQS